MSDLTPDITPESRSKFAIPGSVTVKTRVRPVTQSPSHLHMSVTDWIDDKKLKAAIERSINRSSAFAGIKQSDADYLLEVWVDKIQNVLDMTGEGFVFNFTSVWRLTRTRDNEVLVCEFINGHAGAHAWGSKAYPPAISGATRDMIRKGLFATTDQTTSHFSALAFDENRPSIQQ